jgi:predicted enzyme related to lactoylglutathione lyase
MTKMDKHEPGTFCWIELHTSDGEAAKRFYCDLFGWTPNEMPMGEGQPPYIIAEIGGRQAGAMYQNKEVPPAWLSYVCVTSADESVAKAKSLGATPTSDAFDVFDIGRMCVIKDPEGAHFAVWEPKKHTGVGVKNEPGALTWTELQTRQRDRARDFYTQLFGWTAKESPEYLELHAAGQGIGGMMTMQPQVPAEVPAHWMTYFWVDDVDAAVQKANAGGAATYVPPMDIPNVGRFAVLADPQGAVFAVFKGSMNM